MLSISDIIRLPFPADLTLAGIAIATRRLVFSKNPGEGVEITGLHAKVTRASVELALRRYLLDRNTPVYFHKVNYFTDPTQITLEFGGRLCKIETILILDKQAGRRIAHPEQILEGIFQIPACLHPSDLYTGSDLVLFVFATARVSRDRNDLMSAAGTGEPFLCSHVMPEAWRHPEARKAPGQVSIRYAGEKAITLSLHGLGFQQEYCSEQVDLQPDNVIPSINKFSSVSCLHTSSIPKAHIELLSPAHRNAYKILPFQWRNLWVYGQEIFIAGYLSLEEIGAYWRTAPVTRTGSVPCPQIPVASLHSLPLLLDGITAWLRPG